MFGAAFLCVIIIIMADNGNNVVFIYMGDRRAPRNVTHATVDPSVDTIREGAFYDCRHLLRIEMHDGVKIIEEGAFHECLSLRSIKLLGVRVIERGAFCGCEALEDVEFGDELDKIGSSAFRRCTSIRHIKLPKVRQIEAYAFAVCRQLTDADLPEDLEGIGYDSFGGCSHLRRIAIPLKSDMIGSFAFDGCGSLSRVDLVGGIHKTISSLLLESWRNEMNEEIDSINQVVPNHEEKDTAIQEWIGGVLESMEHYTLEHYALLKDNMTQLELALWKAQLYEREGEGDEFSLSSDLCVLLEKKMTFLEFACLKAKFDEEFADARHEARITCGANIIIPHVLSFLNDDGVFPLRRRDN